MMARIPDTVQQAWGEVVARDFTHWLEAMMTQRSTTLPDNESRFATVEARLESLESRLAKVEARLDAVESRLAKVEARLDAVESRLANVETRLTMVEHDLGELKIEFREFRREVTERFDRLQGLILSQTRWTVGTLALFGTLIAIQIGIGQLGP